MKLRSVLTALALVLGALLAPGVGVLGGATAAHAATKISHATATWPCSRIATVRSLVALSNLPATGTAF